MNDHDPSNNPDSHERDSSVDHPRIWLASLADYNAGRLHGRWVDAAVEPGELLLAAQQMLAQSQEPGAEEWAIFDYDNFGSYRVGEYEDLDHVAAVARGTLENGTSFAAFARLSSARGEELETGFDEAFVGYWKSKDAFLDQIIDDLGLDDALADGIPDWAAAHVRFDRDGLLRDLLIDFEVESAEEGGIYLFRL